MISRKPKIIFEKMGFENFGPFHEYKEIKFSINGDRNVTLISGEIGSGKTTIFQLFWWIMFPEERDKDKKSEIKFLRTKEVINVVNEYTIVQSRINDIITIKGLIEFSWISSSGNSVTYNISRERSYKKVKDLNNSDFSADEELNKDEVLDYVQNSDKIVITKGGNPIEFSEYDRLIKEIFPTAIRNFAFIHGEGMTRILSIENVGQLKKSVLAISDYPKIVGLKLYLDAAMEYFNRKRMDCFRDDKTLMEKAEEIEKAKKEQAKLKKDLIEKQNQQQQYADKLLEIENEWGLLNQNKDYIDSYKKILDELSNLKLRKFGRKGKSRIKGLIDERSDKLQKYAPLIYLENEISLCLNDIREKRNLGIIPGTSIPEQYLRIIINRPENCICGTSWNHDMRKEINELIKTAKKHTYFETINKFEAYLESFIQSIREGKKELYEIQKELFDVNDEIHRIDEEKSRYERTLTEEQKSEDIFKKISKLNQDRDHLNKQVGKIDERIKQIQEKIADKEKEIRDLDIEYNKLESEKGKKKGDKDVLYYKNIYAKLNDVDELRKKVAEIIGNRIREETRTETEHILIQLVKDPDQWKNITISDKSSGWEINAKFGDTVITNISTGMTNILGLSFIFALSNILGVDLPLIFDSPFGNLDAETRELISKNLPPIFKGRQIIFLEKKVNLTGTRGEDGKLRELYPNLKKFIDYEYHLQNQTFIHAQIEEVE